MKGIQEIEQDRHLYPIHLGDHLDSVAAKMAEVATREGVISYCNFNDTELIVAPGEPPEIATARWHAEVDARAEVYRASPAWRAAKAKMDAENVEYQRRHDASMASLPDRFVDHHAALTWMVEYADNSYQTMTMNHDYQSVIAACEASGYAQSDCVGLPNIAYQDPSIAAHYAMGQALACMHKGFIHRIIVNFGKRALTMFGDKP